MIVWGSKGVVANLGPQASRQCPTCEKERPFHLVVQYTVRHVYYIFKWVTGKQYATVCDVCERGNKLDTKLVESRLKKSPIPFGARWGWAFLVGMVAIAGVFVELGNSNRRGSLDSYLATPQKGDLYVVNVASLLQTPKSKYMYAVMRVRGVNADSIEFDAPSIYYDLESGPIKDVRDGRLDKPGYFAPAPVAVPRGEIARIHKEHAIHSIDRGPAPSLTRAL